MSQHRAGPVRSEEARTAILTATGRLMSERGYEHLTMEGVAHAAGVGKQTIYRWWPSRSALVAEALLGGFILGEQFTIPDTGDLRTDLSVWIAHIFALLEEGRGEALVRSLIAVAAENVDVGRRLRESFGGGSSVEERLRRAIAVADLRADAPLPEITEALVGALIIRALSREPAYAGAAERLVDAVLDGNRGSAAAPE